MKKFSGFLLIIAGIMLIIISIMALVQAFDIFTASGTSTESVGHVLGSIIFPLLLTVFGRWVLRKGRGMIKSSKVNEGNDATKGAV